MTTIIAIASFVILALAGWMIAEAKGKFVTYKNDKHEQAVLDQRHCDLEKNGFSELNIEDVKRMIATTGYDAV